MKTVVIVAKGPSALQASNVIEAGESIAVINDSGRLIPDMHIDYFFFAHHTVFEKMNHLRGRFNHAISRTLNAHQLGCMPDWIKERHIMLENLDCDGDLHALHHRLLYGGIMAHHTTTLAMHYLCKHAKYEKIKVIGVDGGVAYAESLERTPSLPADLDLFMQIAKRVAEICHNVYGTKFEWYQYEGGHTG